ncbi:MAG: RidA family protein [Lachnospiraceae bacterium]|nr:RidA family protein [Lachnospiraceae bacterium]
MKERITVPTLPEPKASYSRCLKFDNLLFIAGTGPRDPETGTLCTGSMYEQTRLTALNVKALVEAAGGTLNDIAQLTVFITDYDEYEGYNRGFDEVFKPEVSDCPTRATVQVAKLYGGIKVEMMGIAVLK